MAGSDNFTGQNIQDTYQRVLQLSSSGQLADGTGSLVELLDVTASFAVSASHEITFETSSSYAQTASAAENNFNIASNLYFDSTTPQLFVDGDSMVVFQSAFNQIIVPNLRTGENQGIKFGTDSDYTIKHTDNVKMAILEDTTTRHTFGVGGHLSASAGVNIHLGPGSQDGGEFRGQSANITRITSSIISASSHIHTSTLKGSGDTVSLNVLGSISASGNISSSGTGTNTFLGDISSNGNVITSKTGLPGNQYINYSLDGIEINVDDANAIKIDNDSGTVAIGTSNIPSNTRLLVEGDTTINGHLSASGDLKANNLTIVGDITSVGDDVTMADDLSLTSGAARIMFTGANGGQTEGVLYQDSSAGIRYGLLFPGSDVVALANRAEDGVVQIRANDGTAGSSGEHIVATFDDEKVNIGNAIYLASGSGHITASGDISASGTITGSKGHFGSITLGSRLNANQIGSNGNVGNSEYGTLDGIDITQTIQTQFDGIANKTGSYAITGSDVLFGNITTSGTISASGNIYGSSIIGAPIQLVTHAWYSNTTSDQGLDNLINGNSNFGWADRAWNDSVTKSEIAGGSFANSYDIQKGVPVMHNVTDIELIGNLRPSTAPSGSNDGSGDPYTAGDTSNTGDTNPGNQLNYWLYAGDSPEGDGIQNLRFLASGSSNGKAGILKRAHHNTIYITGSTGLTMDKGEMLYVFAQTTQQATGNVRGNYTVTAKIRE